MSLFDHNPPLIGASDPSDAYANAKQLFLSFYHLPSDLEVNFKAFIANYAETLTSDWHPEKVFGRPDAIMTFKSTTRTLSLGWTIPAFSMEEARANLAAANRLIKFMYPAYEQGNRANTLSKPPLMRIRFANLIRNSAAGDDPSARIAGLLGTVGQLTVTPSFDDNGGFFDPGVATLYPKVLTISCNFTVLHEHDVGWGPEIGFNDPELAEYPYGQTAGVFPAPSTGPAGQLSEVITAASNDADRDEAAASALAIDDPTRMDTGERYPGDLGPTATPAGPDVDQRAAAALPGQAI